VPGENYPLTPAAFRLHPACINGANWIALSQSFRRPNMGINTERDIEANLQIGPTDAGMVRIFVESAQIEIPMDFDPEEAEEIADEIRAAATAARARKK
jgi:hypothetical protein